METHRLVKQFAMLKTVGQNRILLTINQNQSASCYKHKTQGFLSGGKGWGGNFTGGGFFLLGEGNLRRSDFDDSNQPFAKLKTAFCEYWTSIKIKIDMSWKSKEYEIETKMEQEQWLQLKMLFLLGYNLKIVI